MIPEPQRGVLLVLIDLLAGLEQPWVVTGSTGMALQGVPLEAHDIDLQTDAAGAYAIGQRLSAFVVTPVHERISPRIRSHFGVFVIDGVTVEVMGAVQKLIDGLWEASVTVEEHRRWFLLEGQTVPVLSLVYEEQAYRAFGRIERAELLRRWLDDNPGQVL